MPKSRIRKKADFTPPPEKKTTDLGLSGQGHGWVAPLMLAMFVVGLVWIILYYVSQSTLPVESLGGWNIVVGFGFIAAGFVVSTQWK